jgi:kumamolisin
MKIRPSIAPLLVAATLLALVSPIIASGQALIPTTITIPPSSVVHPGDAGVRAHTNLRVLGAGSIGGTSKPQASGPPFPGYLFHTPASLACIYELVPGFAGCNPNVVDLVPEGGSRAIAIVDAYDDPNAYSDLQNFSAQFGVPGISPSSFEVVYAPAGGAAPGSCTGPATQPPSAATNGWDLEESLDIEYAHAMAPRAKLYLVEAQSDYNTDLYCAVSVASNLVAAAGGGEVNMSWGGTEFPQETFVDSIFTKHNVVYLAAAGDAPGVDYPSSSPNVVAVGGTSLSMNLNTGRFESENAWQEGAGGTSAYERRPSYQNGIVGLVGSQRGVPDISANANTWTDVWVLDSLGYPSSPWILVYGTSVASCTMAGIVNAADSFEDSTQDELSKIYKNPNGFYDITYGNCGPYMGYFSAPGWDFCTGLGSPRTYAGK